MKSGKPSTQEELNAKIREIMVEAAKEVPFEITNSTSPIAAKVAQLINYKALESLFFGCLRCGKPVENAYSWCAECVSKMPKCESLVEEIFDQSER